MIGIAIFFSDVNEVGRESGAGRVSFLLSVTDGVGDRGLRFREL